MFLNKISYLAVVICLGLIIAGARAADHNPTGLTATPRGLTGLAGNEFAVATSAPWPDSVPSHVHSDDTDPFGVGPNFAEVGECCSGNSLEEVRGLAEFDLAGQTLVGQALLVFEVNAQGGLFGQPGGDFEIVFETYDGNNLEEMADYAAVTTGAVGTVTTGGLIPGETLTFDVTTQFNDAVLGAVPALGVLARATTGPVGAAIVFENFEIRTGETALFFSQDSNPNGLHLLDTATGMATLHGAGVTGVDSLTVGLAPSGVATELLGSQPFAIVRIRTDGNDATTLPGSVTAEGLAYCATAGTFFGSINGTFFAIDPATGLELALLPPPGFDVEGLACDDANSLIYGIGDGDDLVVYDVVGGSWSTVGNTGLNWDSGGLAFDPLGILYAIGEEGADNLFAIDPLTAVPTLIGPTGVTPTGGGLAVVSQFQSPIFIDGFESGDTSVWSSDVGIFQGFRR